MQAAVMRYQNIHTQWSFEQTQLCHVQLIMLNVKVGTLLLFRMFYVLCTNAHNMKV